MSHYTDCFCIQLEHLSLAKILSEITTGDRHAPKREGGVCVCVCLGMNEVQTLDLAEYFTGDLDNSIL